MQSLDQHLVELHHARAISGTEAMRLAHNPEAVGEGAPHRDPAVPTPIALPQAIIDVPHIPRIASRLFQAFNNLARCDPSIFGLL